MDEKYIENENFNDSKNRTPTRKMNSDLEYTKTNFKDKLNETMKSKRSVTSNHNRPIGQSEIFNPENDHSNMSTKYDRQMIELTDDNNSKSVIKVDKQVTEIVNLF